MRQTKEFILLSGVKCVIQELTGKHERMLTTKKSDTRNAYTEMLTDCILSLGDISPVNQNHVKRMLEADRKHALIELRQFSNDYDPKFKFSYEFALTGGKREKHEYEVDFSFAVVDVVKKEAEEEVEGETELIDKKNSEVNFVAKPYFKKWNSYSEIANDKKQTIILPKSGETIEFSMLDGETTELFGPKHEDEITSHTLIKMRNPLVIRQDEKGVKKPGIKLELDNLSFKDINFLREKILELEGNIDTTMVIAHPSDPSRTARVDLINLASFFFPSLVL